MMQMLSLVRRDVRRAYQSGGMLLPVCFFLLVATLYPFAVGPDGPVLSKTGGGILWVAALLAALLPIDRLMAPDIEHGVIDQLSLRGMSDEVIGLAKIIGHWVGFGPPLMLAALPASALLRLDSSTLIILELGLAIATPALAALGVIVSALTAGLRGASALASLLLLPLAIPLLIFGAGALSGGSAGLKLLAAVALFMFALAPFAIGAALRAARS